MRAAGEVIWGCGGCPFFHAVGCELVDGEGGCGNWRAGCLDDECVSAGVGSVDWDEVCCCCSCYSLLAGRDVEWGFGGNLGRDEVSVKVQERARFHRFAAVVAAAGNERCVYCVWGFF